METLMRKIDKLNNEIISKHDISSRKGKDIKTSTRWALFSPDKNVA